MIGAQLYSDIQKKIPPLKRWSLRSRLPLTGSTIPTPLRRSAGQITRRSSTAGTRTKPNSRHFLRTSMRSRRLSHPGSRNPSMLSTASPAMFSLPPPKSEAAEACLADKIDTGFQIHLGIIQDGFRFFLNDRIRRFLRLHSGCIHPTGDHGKENKCRKQSHYNVLSHNANSFFQSTR